MDFSEKFGLPEFRFMTPRSEADYYGLSSFIAEKLKLSEIPISAASWLHGWRFQEVTRVGELVLPFNTHLKRHLVAKEKHEVFLRGKGIEAHTVGMPFCYFLDDSIREQENSGAKGNILVMPSHSVKGNASGQEEKAYIKYLVENRPASSNLCFCIHRDCVTNGLWVEELEKNKIPYVIGATIPDMNAMARMIKIYRNFEYMTTNTFGSHIIQASLCNLKVSYCGPLHVYKLGEVIKKNRWLYKKEDIESYKNLIKGYHPSVLEKQYPQFFCTIGESKKNQQWALEESGYYKKVSFEHLSRLLGWDHSLSNWLDYHSLRYARLVKRDIGFYLNKFVG